MPRSDAGLVGTRLRRLGRRLLDILYAALSFRSF
jgi:hypothetical protein